MTPLFRPAAIEARRRRLHGPVALWQPVSLGVFCALAVAVTVLLAGYLASGSYARKETVTGWLAPADGLAEVRAPGGVVAAVAARAGDAVAAGQALIWLDLSASGGSVWNRELPTSGMVISAPVSGTVVAMAARRGEVVLPQVVLATIAPEGSPLEARLLVPTRAAGLVQPGQDVRLMVDAWPFQRFGAVEGTVHEIAHAVIRPGELAAPVEFKEAVYLVRVRVPRPAITAYGALRPLDNGMTLKADLVTDRRTLLQWLLDPLLAARGRM
jgi:multidrug efflux pump subunit AcrA (membrane-fusion protein)